MRRGQVISLEWCGVYPKPMPEITQGEVVAVSDVPFPFWIVTQRRGQISQPVEPEGVEGYAATFSKAEDAARFMVARKVAAWETTLVVGPATLAPVVADLRRIGMQGLCFNPTAEGGGVTMTFDQLEARSEATTR